MAEIRKYEKQFFDALRDIFVGAKIEGDSGYINLMRIKSRYYEQGVFPILKQDINKALKPFPDFREELFDKLYTFFQRYFSESGSIYFRYTPLHQNIYEKVYTDDRDVMLFWKTHMLYYVKTDRIFNSLSVEVDGYKFFFDASKMELKKSNEKREVIYTFRSLNEEGALVFDVSYSERGRTTKMDDIIKELRRSGQQLTDDILTRAFRVFEKQSEVDYFINKNARAFLQEQFDLWMYQYLFAGQNVWGTERLAQLQALKDIAFKIIDFISQFEDELVKIWNKPKFVRNSHYIITLDHVIASAAGAKQSPTLLDSILAHPNMPDQVQEWQDLAFLPADFRLEMITQRDLAGYLVYPQYQFLSLDTKYFPDLELDILSIFEDLDASLDGWLIHSENYQGLNSINLKFHSLANVTYTDPPFNTAATEIIYQNEYKHSSWVSMMNDRIGKSYDLLAPDGISCIAIDDFEFPFLTLVINQVFDEQNRLAVVPIRSNPHGRAMASGFSQNHEYAIFHRKSSKSIVGRLPRDERLQSRYSEKDEFGNFSWMNFRATGANSRRIDRPKLYYPIYVGKGGKIRIVNLTWSDENQSWIPREEPKNDEVLVFPIDSDNQERVWNLGWERAAQVAPFDLVAKNVNGDWQIYRKYRPNLEGTLPNTWWDDAKYSATESGTSVLKSLFGERESFSYPKSIYLVSDCLLAANCTKTSLILDYFAGSGTTAHAVMVLNQSDGGKRKYILIEMGSHFYSVIIPRIKKVAYSSKWKAGKPVIAQGVSVFVKYCDLEQYEDTLHKSVYRDTDLFNNPYEDPYHSYIFLRDEKMLSALVVDTAGNAAHIHPERLYPDIDLAETISQRRGKWIKRITKEYVEFQDGEKQSLIDPDWQVLKPLIWW